MKTKPNARQMLFSGPMVRSLLSGTKTKTRRIIKVPEFVEEASDGSPHWQPQRCGAGWEFLEWSTDYALAHPLRCPYGQRGDRLWVRETWSGQEFAGRDVRVRYQADQASVKMDAASIPHGYVLPLACRRTDGWAPSIHMPRWASRFTLEITDVRVERLNEISVADAKAEGLTRVDGGIAVWGIPGDDNSWNHDPRWSYRALWESIHGSGSWDTNPWVWVLSFKRVGT